MAERKSQKGKNRRDAHGVYERKELRGKAKTTRRDTTEEKPRNSYLKDQRKYRTQKESGRSRSEDTNRKRQDAGREFREATEGEFLIGRNPVIEALRSGREIEKIYMAEGIVGSAAVIRGLARDQGVVIDVVPKIRLDKMMPGEKHQGVIAEIPAYHYSGMEDIYEKARVSGEEPFIIVLDEIHDPHNLGAIIRTAECAGAHGIIIPKRRACGLTQTVAKSSAGAIENVPVVRVTNLGRTIEELQARGIWVTALDMEGENCFRAAFDGPIALVVGNEGRGISRNVLEKCDRVCSIPMKGKINSLNASNAAAIVMYEVLRRRSGGEFTHL